MPIESVCALSARGQTATGQLVNVNDALVIPLDANLSGYLSYTMGANATGTVVMEISPQVNAAGDDEWYALRAVNVAAGVNAGLDSLTGSAVTQQAYQFIPGGARKARVRKTAGVGAAQCSIAARYY